MGTFWQKLGPYIIKDAFDHLADKLYRPHQKAIRLTIDRQNAAVSMNPFGTVEEAPFETIRLQLDDIVARLQSVFNQIHVRSIHEIAHAAFMYFVAWWKDIALYRQSSRNDENEDDMDSETLSSRVLYDATSYTFVVDDLEAVEEAFIKRLLINEGSIQRPLLGKQTTQQTTKPLLHFLRVYGPLSTKRLQQIWQAQRKSSPSHIAPSSTLTASPTNPFLNDTAETQVTEPVLSENEKDWLLRLLCRRHDAPLDLLLKSSKGTGSKLGILVHHSGDKASSLFQKILKPKQ